MWFLLLNPCLIRVGLWVAMGKHEAKICYLAFGKLCGDGTCMYCCCRPAAVCVYSHLVTRMHREKFTLAISILINIILCLLWTSFYTYWCKQRDHECSVLHHQNYRKWCRYLFIKVVCINYDPPRAYSAAALLSTSMTEPKYAAFCKKRQSRI